MKKIPKKILALLLVVAICIGLCIFLSSYTNSMKDSEESIAVTDALIGAYATMGKLRQYTSPDGLTSSLSVAERDAQMKSFSQEVNQYYSRKNPCYESDKEANRYRLEKICKETVQQVLECGASIYEINSLDFNKEYTEATISCRIIRWTKGITRKEETGKYQAMQNPVGMNFITAKMVKEDGSWKLLDFLKYIPLSIWSTDDVLHNAVLNSNKPSRANSEELELCRKNEAIVNTQYDTYQEALAAVGSMDLEHGNYYALAKLCGADLSGVRNGA